MGYKLEVKRQISVQNASSEKDRIKVEIMSSLYGSKFPQHSFTTSTIHTEFFFNLHSTEYHA